MKKLTVFCVLLLLTAGISCKKEEKEVETLKIVKVSKVKVMDNSSKMVYPCRSKFLKESKLSFRIPGNIEKINVNVGEFVKKGDVIATLDSKDYKLLLRQAEANLSNANHQLEMAENIYKRVKALFVNDNVSKNDYDKAKAGYFSAKSMNLAVKESVELAKHRVTYTKLVAPVDGKIAYVLAEEGENLGEFHPLCKLNNLKGIEVTALVPDTAILLINVGDKAKVKFNVFSDSFFEGVVTETGVSAVGEGNSYMVTVQLETTDVNLKSGLIGDVFFDDNKYKQLAVVPSNAIFADMENSFVYLVIDRNGKYFVKKKKVKTGELTSQGFQILSGVKNGEVIVTAGLSQLEDNMEVKIMDAVEN